MLQQCLQYSTFAFTMLTYRRPSFCTSRIFQTWITKRTDIMYDINFLHINFLMPVCKSRSLAQKWLKRFENGKRSWILLLKEASRKILESPSWQILKIQFFSTSTRHIAKFTTVGHRTIREYELSDVLKQNGDHQKF